MKKLLLIISTAFALSVNAQAPTAVGEALSFNGSNVVTNSSYSAFDEYTMEVWVKLNTLAANSIIAGTNASGPVNALGISLRVNSSGKFEHLTFDGSDKTLQSPITLTTGTWYHVAISAKAGGNMKIVVNGNETVSTFSVGTLWYGLTTITLGVNTMGGFGKFVGAMDEFRVWNRQLCLNEIVNNKDGEIPTSSTGLITNFHFNQGVAGGNNSTITTAWDLSGYAKNGALMLFSLTGSASNWTAPGAVTSGIAVSAFALPTFSISPSTTLACIGSVVTLTATGNAFDYEWSNGVTTSTTSLVQPAGAFQTIYLQGYDVNGCYGSNVGLIIFGTDIPVISTDLGYACSGSSYTISPTILAGGPITSYTYSTGSSIITPTSTTYYTVYGANADGCIGSATGTVEVCGASINALNMNGSDDFLQTGIPYSVFSNNWTLECWAKSPASPTMSQHNGPMYGESMSIIWDHANSGYKGSATVKTANNNYYAASYGTLSPNTWYHLAATYDGTVLRAYKNGVLTNSITTTGGLAVPTGSLMFGRHPSLNQFWNGTIDEARVWTVNRTCSEINQFMNTELVGNETGLKAYYKFNEGIPAANNTSITSTTDDSGNGYNSSITGFARAGTASNYMLGAPFNNSTNPLCLSSGIIEQTKNTNILVHPNPSTSILNIEVKEQTQISIVNILGEIIKTQIIEEKTSIDVSNLNNGIYFIQDLKSGKAVKFIKE